MKRAELILQREKLRAGAKVTSADLDDVWGAACVAAAACEAAGLVLPPEAAGFFAVARRRLTGERRARWEGRHRATVAVRLCRAAQGVVEDEPSGE